MLPGHRQQFSIAELIVIEGEHALHPGEQGWMATLQVIQQQLSKVALARAMADQQHPLRLRDQTTESLEQVGVDRGPLTRQITFLAMGGALAGPPDAVTAQLAVLDGVALELIGLALPVAEPEHEPTGLITPRCSRPRSPGMQGIDARLLQQMPQAHHGIGIQGGGGLTGPVQPGVGAILQTDLDPPVGQMGDGATEGLDQPLHLPHGEAMGNGVGEQSPEGAFVLECHPTLACAWRVWIAAADNGVRCRSTRQQRQRERSSSRSRRKPQTKPQAPPNPCICSKPVRDAPLSAMALIRGANCWQTAANALPSMVCPRQLLALASLGAVLLVSGCASEEGGVESQKMATIKGRGSLVCGVDGKLPGFSFIGSDGKYSGLDVDVCQAVAAALLSDPTKVEYRDLNSSERFAALASGEVDLLSRNTTYTLSRDAAGGNSLSFGPTTFYDGQGVMTLKSSGVRSLKDLAGKPICVESGTTTELNLADRMRQINATYTPLKFQTGDQTYAAYLGGRCVAVTSDRSQLAAKRTSFPRPDDHILLPDVLSKEPLTPASVNADPAWADVIRWTVYALMQAEEFGITKANIDSKLSEAKANSNLAELRRFLGVEGDFGKQLGLPADFVVSVIRAVGNYGEIFDRNVGPASALKLDRGLNRQWSNGGLIYSPPFR